MHVGREVLAGSLRTQAGWCERLGSPLYGRLLERAAGDVMVGGPVWKVLGEFTDARADAAPLGLLGAVHRLVLEGRLPDLAQFYPSVGGDAGAGDPWPAFRGALEEHREELAELVRRPIQTNEVGRAASLLGGFLLVARETGLPLALVEIGAAAGLNLRFDRYRYESSDGWAFGPPESPVRFVEPFAEGPKPPHGVVLEVTSRRGADLASVDPTAEVGGLTLLSYVWPDQAERVARLRGALRVARDVPAEVDQAEGVGWAESVLAEPAPGAATMVFHSVIELYLTGEERARLRSILEDAGRRATPTAPVAWLRMEHVDTGLPDAPGWKRLAPPEIRLTVWPGGRERLVARSGAHGPPVYWLE